MNFSIIIPIYNEEKNILLLLKEIKKALFKYEYEIIIIDDASTDNSVYEINKLQKKYNIVLLINKINKGQSFSLHRGILKSQSDIIVTLDGDGQNNPKDIPLLVEKYSSDDKLFLVGGIRFERKDSLIKIISSRIANNVRSKILKDGCMDTGCSLKVFDKKIFVNFPYFDGIHRFLPALFKGYGKNTFFINVNHRQRIHGYSKYGTFLRLYRGIKDLIKVAKIIKKFKRNRA